MMRITVIGAGGIGGVVGGCLARAGLDVELIDIEKTHIDKIKKDGLKVLSTDGDWIAHPKAYTVEEFLAVNDEKLDCVVLAVKAPATKSALTPFLPFFGGDTFLIPLQNGFISDVIAEMIGKERTLTAFVNIFADYMEPGMVNYGGRGALVIGELIGEITPRLEKIRKLWSKGIEQIRIDSNVRGYLWAKAGYSAILRATTLTNETIADVIDNRRYREMLMDLASEPLELAVKEGIRPEGFDEWDPKDAYPRENRDPEAMNRHLDEHVQRLRTYTKVHSGVWRDIAVRGRKIEVHAGSDELVEKGKKYGLTFPLYTLLYELLFQLEAGQIPFSTEHLEVLLKKDMEIYHS